MGKDGARVAEEEVGTLILLVRQRRVILDVDLAHLYRVTTKALNQAVKRNQNRFPEDFAFRLTAAEFAAARSCSPRQAQAADPIANTGNRSQFVTGSQRHRDPRSRPLASTEHGALMAANVLRSDNAAQMSIFVIRAFLRLRERIAANDSIAKHLAEIDSRLLHHDAALRELYRKILPLLQPPPDPPRRRIGFHVDDA
jgi:hypothetical protein